MDKNSLLTHLNNGLYQDARKLWNGVQVQQIVKGAEKYPEPLNPDSWTAVELIMHAMQENVDQAHYLTALLSKLSDERRKVPVKVKKLKPDAVIPKYAKPGDAGFDLVAVEDVIIGPGDSGIAVPIGLAFALPDGYELQVRPRSGIGKRTKLRISNSPGTVDSGYRGEVVMMFDNIHPITEGEWVSTLDVSGKEIIGTKAPKGTYMVRKGDRVAQGVIAAVPFAKFEEADELDETERGDKGFGSSGVGTI